MEDEKLRKVLGRKIKRTVTTPFTLRFLADRQKLKKKKKPQCVAYVQAILICNQFCCMEHV